MVKVAFAGCGGSMREHWEHLRQLEDVSLVGCHDLDPECTAQGAAHCGCDAYDDYLAMLNEAKPDALYIHVPPYAHGPIEEAAAERGIHMFIEKPVALEAKAARKISGVIKRAGVLSCVGYRYRYCETAALARQYLRGKPLSLVTGAWRMGMREEWWWRRRDKSGGQLVEQSTHLFDLLRYLCGEVAEVHAMASTGCLSRVKDFDIDESSVVSLRLKNGASASISSSCVSNNGSSMRLEILTPDAVLELRQGELRIEDAAKTTIYRAHADPLAEQHSAFLDAVKHGRRGRIRSTYADALKTFLLTCAANESIASGLPVKP